MRFRRLIEEMLNERHEHWNMPPEGEVDVNINPNNPMYQEARTPGTKFLDIGYAGYVPDDRTIVAEVTTPVKIHKLMVLRGAMGEARNWEPVGDSWWFGNWTLEEWHEKVKDIARNGLIYPVFVWNKEKRTVLAEGNHRLAVYDYLKIPKIPTRIQWTGNHYGIINDPFKDIFHREFGTRREVQIKNWGKSEDQL